MLDDSPQKEDGNEAVSPFFAGIVIGSSARMQSVAAMIRQVALYPSTTILLQGESGTGKDVVARAIHELGSRASAPFVDINCAAIPETLLETELFGVEAGAFTDAKFSRDGYLWRANGGTLFLDEINSMPLTLQAKLLRFLEERTFRPVGSTHELQVDLRVISASNTDLQAAVACKAFRDDLFYRLKVITIVLPSLRERLEDLEVLTHHFLRIYSADLELPLTIDDEVMTLLRQYSWPGNIRELRNVIQRGQILCDDHHIRSKDLPDSLRKMSFTGLERLDEIRQQIHLPSEGLDLRAFLLKIELTLLQEALERCDGNQVQAAQLLNVSRDQLRYRLPLLAASKSS